MRWKVFLLPFFSEKVCVGVLSFLPLWENSPLEWIIWVWRSSSLPFFLSLSFLSVHTHSYIYVCIYISITPVSFFKCLPFPHGFNFVLLSKIMYISWIGYLGFRSVHKNFRISLIFPTNSLAGVLIWISIYL